MNKKYHYTYLITERSTNKKYIGVRSSSIEPSQDIGIKYFSSSSDKSFIKRQKQYPNDYEYIVLSVHNDRKSANEKEIELHKEYNVSSSSDYYNKANASATSFNPIGRINVRDENGNILQVSVNDERYVKGELRAFAYGKVVVKDSNGNILHVDKNDQRYLKKELISITCNKVTVKDKNGNISQVNINDPLYQSGELVSISCNYVCVRDKDGKCFRVSVDDPRYLSGELVHNMVGQKLTETHKRNISNACIGILNGFYGKTQTEKCKDAVSNVYEIDGIKYRSRNEVATAYNINIRTVANRCKSDKWPDWKLITKRK